MDSVGIPWNSAILVGIQRIPPELMGESKDLEPSAKFHSTGFHQNDRIPAGIGGALLRPPLNCLRCQCYPCFYVIINFCSSPFPSQS